MRLLKAGAYLLVSVALIILAIKLAALLILVVALGPRIGVY